MNNQLAEYRFTDRDRAATVLALDLVLHIYAAIDNNGTASLVFPGGSTPGTVLEQFSRAALDWKQISVTLSDERWVGPEDSLSNEAMLRKHLLQGPAEAIEFTSLYEPGVAVEKGCGIVEKRLEKFPRPVDAVMLGMGADGHTASLFPGHAGLTAALGSSKLCAAVSGPDIDPARISLTPAALLNSKKIFILIFGTEKLAIYKAARSGQCVSEYPVRCILNQAEVPVSVYWAP